MRKKTTFTRDRALEVMRPLAEVLTPSQSQEFLRNVQVLQLKPGEELYREGDFPVYLCCLADGAIKVSRHGVSREIILRIILEKGIFGYRSFFAHQSHITTAAAFTDAVVYVVPLRLVDKWMSDNAMLAGFFVNELSIDLGRSDARLLNFTQKKLRGRLADALLMLISKFGYEDDGETISARLSREDLACLANMERANAIRTLATFVDEGIIESSGRAIKIKDLKALQTTSRIG